MNYKKLISERLKDEKYFLIFVLYFLKVILVGVIIVDKMNLRTFIVFFVIFVFFIIWYFYRFKLFNNVYEKLSVEEKRELNLDIEQTYFFSGRDYALSSKYIINFQKPKIIKYSSILIIDKTTGLSQHGKTHIACDMIYIFTKNEKVSLVVKEYETITIKVSKNSYYEGLYSYIKAQNPNVLEGYTKENRKMIKEKYGIEI